MSPKAYRLFGGYWSFGSLRCVWAACGCKTQQDKKYTAGQKANVATMSEAGSNKRTCNMRSTNVQLSYSIVLESIYSFVFLAVSTLTLYRTLAVLFICVNGWDLIVNPSVLSSNRRSNTAHRVHTCPEHASALESVTGEYLLFSTPSSVVSLERIFATK